MPRSKPSRPWGLKDGPIHAELRLNDQGPWVIEVGARSIGGLCARACTQVWRAGISLEELIFEPRLGIAHRDHGA